MAKQGGHLLGWPAHTVKWPGKVAKQYYEQPREDSNVDLLIVVRESARSHASAIEVYRALRGLCVPVEVKVVTQREVEVPSDRSIECCWSACCKPIRSLTGASDSVRWSPKSCPHPAEAR